MSGHVIYACPCLNIRIHLSSKYSLRSHATERQQYWFQQDNPPMEGWQLELGMGAVVVAYSSLIETATSPTHPWMTVGCLNCDLKSVYSMYSKNNSNRSSTSLASGQNTDSVVIHKGTIFGHELDDVRNDDQFSDIFDIKLSSLTAPVSVVHQNEVPEKLRAQHQELYQVLEKALDKMRLASEVRIEQWKRIEMERLDEDSNKAREESNRLWQKVLSVNHVQTQHPVHTKTKHSTATAATMKAATTPLMAESIGNSSSSSSSSSISPSSPPSSVISAAILSSSNKSASPPRPAPTSLSPSPSSSAVSVPALSNKIDRQPESKRSHTVRFMDNSNGSEPPVSSLPTSYRRSSFSLNHSAITTNLANYSDTTTENTLHVIANDSKHTRQPENDAGEVEDEEDLFVLDEELGSDDEPPRNEKEDEDQSKEEDHADRTDSPAEVLAKIKSEQSSYGSSWIKKRNLDKKYIEDFADTGHQEEEHEDTEDNNEAEISQSISKYATSMPININSAMSSFAPSNEDNTDSTNGNNEMQSSPPPPPPLRYDQQKLTSQSFAATRTSTSKSFIGYDFSFSDRAISKQFPDYNPVRRKSVAAIPSGRRHPQLDALIEKSSLDTRVMKK